jgi:hypothetical protein
MKINIIDFIIICLGLIYGTDETFIDQHQRFSDEIVGILSFIISIWFAISCASSLKRKSKS